MADRMPAATHLQYLVLMLLKNGDLPGREIRRILAQYGVRRTGAAFYQMMARLERVRWVEGWYEQIAVGDQAVTERRYRLRAGGARACDEARAFYESVAVAAARKRWSDA
jgi:DNA-binding PadR family transcriptional regulator